MPLIGAIGDLTVDIILRGLSEMPSWGKEIEINDTSKRMGGNVGNLAVGAGALRTDLAVVADIGDDENGRFVLSQLEKRKLDTSYVRRLPGQQTSKTYACIRGDGERFMLTEKGTLSGIEDTVMRTDIPDCRVLFLGGWCLPPRVALDKIQPRFEQWHREGKILATDLIWSEETWETKEKLVQFLKSIDIVFLNELELMSLTACETQEEGLRDLRELLQLKQRKNAVAIVKCGADGAIMVTGDDCIRARPYRCTPIDTVGAGDLFNLGYLHARYQLQMEKQQAIDFATTFASLFISNYGIKEPNEQDVLDALRKN